VSGSGICWAICKSAPHADNHANIPPLCFLQAGCPSWRPAVLKELTMQLLNHSNCVQFLKFPSHILVLLWDRYCTMCTNFNKMKTLAQVTVVSSCNYSGRLLLLHCKWLHLNIRSLTYCNLWHMVNWYVVKPVFSTFCTSMHSHNFTVYFLYGHHTYVAYFKCVLTTTSTQSIHNVANADIGSPAFYGHCQM